MTLGDGASPNEFWVESRIQSTKVGGLERVKHPSRKNPSAFGWGEDMLIFCRDSWKDQWGSMHGGRGAYYRLTFCLLETDEPSGLWLSKYCSA